MKRKEKKTSRRTSAKGKGRIRKMGFFGLPFLPASTSLPGGLQRTWLGREVVHQARKERVDGSQNFGVSARHARSDASLERLEATQDHRRLEHGEQKAEDFQSSADVGKVGLVGLFLEQRHWRDKEDLKRQPGKKILSAPTSKEACLVGTVSRPSVVFF